MPLATIQIAVDRSARSVDVDGRLHLDKSHISKAAVNPYYGREIPGWQALGLEAERIYQLLRDPAELEKSAPTFERLQIIKRHTTTPVTVEATNKDLVIGTIGSNVAFNAPYLDADLCFWDAEAIAAIESDQVRELSCGYRYTAVMEPGTYEGQAYDGRMTDIIGNHLALVEVGRAGSDVLVADHNPFPKVTRMKMTKLGKALFTVLCAASPVLAADAALPALVGQANRKKLKLADLKAALIAKDAEMDPQQLDNILDAILGVEDEPQVVQTPAAVGDESPADKIRNLLAGKVEDDVLNAVLGCIPAPASAVDTYDEEGMKKEEVEAAMDAMRKEWREAQIAAEEVRPIVGAVIGEDSAAAIYSLALKQLGVDHAGVEGVAALRAMVKLAKEKTAAPAQVVIAGDAAAAAIKKFPGAARFSRI